jgi:hypothetical protein
VKSFEGALIEILTRLAEEEDILKYAKETPTGYYCFISYLQEQLGEKTQEFVPAKELIKTMEILRVQPKVPDKVKETIEFIFSVMDPRDQNYRYGDCHCASCQFFRNPTQENLEKALKELERLKKKKKNQKSDEPIIGPEVHA